MQGYIKGSWMSLIPVQYSVLVEASMKGYSKGSVGPIILLHYDG
jgi:hypothetical protein